MSSNNHRVSSLVILPPASSPESVAAATKALLETNGRYDGRVVVVNPPEIVAREGIAVVCAHTAKELYRKLTGR